jgi:hypothetical protein
VAAAGACSTSTTGTASNGGENSVSATPTPSASNATAQVSPGATSPAAPVNDWTHCLQVFAYLKASPPSDPVVLLLGGSGARECSISDKTWHDQVVAAGIPTVQVYDLGSRNRTTAQDIALINKLPKGKLRGIVFIGINLTRFTWPTKAVNVTLPSSIHARGDLSPYPQRQQHHYSQSRIFTPSAKRLAVSKWIVKRNPLFEAYYTKSAQSLATLITACKNHGLHPVLLDLPRNMAAMGHELDAQIARYTATCTELQDKYKVPFLSFVAKANLTTSDFYDLWHLVEPGRTKWQKILSAETAQLMKKYGLGNAAP